MAKDSKGHGSAKRSGATFAQALATQQRLEKAHETAGKKIEGMSGGGKMGMTPDAVKTSPEWRSANSKYQAAHSALRAHNQSFTKEYKKDLSAHRDAQRMAKLRK